MKQKTQLFLLHFAGGNSYSYQFMLPYLDDFDVIQLELPGRGNRIKETLFTEFDLAAEDIYQQIMARQTSPDYLIYGHSLGSYLALRVTGMLEKAFRPPAYLLVSGNPGPGVRDSKKRYLYGREAFIEELRLLGGVPDELFEHEELFDFFEPILRADFELAEKNNMSEDKPVNSPIYALMGSEEEDVDKLSNWHKFTNSDFQCEVLEGNHFFILNHPQRITHLIKQCYKKVAIPPYHNGEVPIRVVE
jgi:external thioesterase TEII